jgi:hypothetical protein
MREDFTWENSLPEEKEIPHPIFQPSEPGFSQALARFNVSSPKPLEIPNALLARNAEAA